MCPLRQSKTQSSQIFPNVQQSTASRGLRISLVTLDLLHCLFRRPQTNDRAQVSTSVHILHLVSDIRRILCSRNFAQRESLTLQEISFTNKKRSSTYFVRARPMFVCCDIVAVLSECRANFNSTPNSFAIAQKSPSHAPLPSAYPSATAVMIVQPPSCTVDHHLKRVDILQGSRVPMRYLQMHFALCMSRAEGLCTLLEHSLTQH